MIPLPRRSALRPIAAGLLLATASCSIDTGLSRPATTIFVYADAPILLPGQSSQLHTWGLAEDGLAGNVGPVDWTSSAPTIVSVNSRGKVTAQAVGNATIYAHNGQTGASTLLKVRAAFCTPLTTVGPIPLGTPTDGTLSLADCAYEGLVSDPYSLSVASPTALAVATSGTPITPAPLVTTAALVDVPSGEFGLGSPPLGGRLVYQLAAGNYRVWMRSTGTPELGSYSITATAVTNCAPAQAVGGFVLGATRSGTLDPVADCYFGDGSQGDGQTFSLADSAFLTVTTTSADFIPIALVTTPAMSGFNHIFDARPNDTTRVQVFQLPPQHFVLWTNPEQDDFGAGDFTQTTGTIPNCFQAGMPGPIALGATVVDTLTLDDCVLGTPQPVLADGWVLTLAAPTMLQADITNSAGTAFAQLFLRTEAGLAINANRITLSPVKYRIEQQLAAGTYLLYAGASSGAGAFTVEVRAIP